jgi:4'-phosphopantetheinyl transferase EntD
MNEFSIDGLVFCLIDQADFRTEELHPLERAALAPGASPSRLVQFGLGRAAARHALRRLERESSFSASAASSSSPLMSLGEAPLLIDSFGAPIWPERTTGSLSHTRRFEGGQRRGIFSAVAVVGASSHYHSVGIDLEDSDRLLSPEIVKKVASPSEAEWVLAEQVSPPPNTADLPARSRLLFLLSAKEALYKAIFPLCHQYFGFLDAELVLGGEEFPKHIRLCKTLSPAAVKGSQFSIGSAKLDRLALVWIAVPKDLTI